MTRLNYEYAHIKKAYDVMSLLAETAYDTAPERVYFLGGSTGGREGLTAATRWPESYDGGIRCYPTAFFMGLRLWGVALADAIYSDDSAGWFPLEIVETIAERAVALCDPLDGAEDGIVSNPAECRAISSSIVEDLRCPADQVAANCLNQTQIDRVINVYHNGCTLPCEIGGWSEYKGYNSLEGVVMNIGTQAEYINPPPSGTNAHHVNRAFQFMSNFVDTSEDFDLLEFDIQEPGEFHGGGPFNPQIDTLTALDNWVENGIPPAGLVMVDGTNSETRGRTRPVCEYPAFPRYNGDGDIDEASSYHCATE